MRICTCPCRRWTIGFACARSTTTASRAGHEGGRPLTAFERQGYFAGAEVSPLEPRLLAGRTGPCVFTQRTSRCCAISLRRVEWELNRAHRALAAGTGRWSSASAAGTHAAKHSFDSWPSLCALQKCCGQIQICTSPWGLESCPVVHLGRSSYRPPEAEPLPGLYIMQAVLSHASAMHLA